MAKTYSISLPKSAPEDRELENRFGNSRKSASLFIELDEKNKVRSRAIKIVFTL